MHIGQVWKRVVWLGAWLWMVQAAGAQAVLDLPSEEEAARFGLTRAWFGHFSKSTAADHLLGWRLYVPPAPQTSKTSAEENTDSEEKPGGADSAATKPAEPVMMYVQSAHGRLHAVEAETGRVRWSAQVGPARLPCQLPAASARWLAVVHGLSLKLLDRHTGELIWERKLNHASMVGPAILNGWVVVASVGGQLTGFRIENPVDQWHGIADSQIITPLATTTTAVVWCTVQGRVYPGLYDSGRFAVALPTQGMIPVRPTTWNHLVYVPTTNGFVFALDTRRGELVWRHSAADPVYEPLVVTQDAVFVVHALSRLHCLDRATGRVRWTTTGMKKILAVSAKRLYVLQRNDLVAVVDRPTGARLGTLPWRVGDLLVTNTQTDRIYLATRRGFIVCLHEAEQKEPLIHLRHEPPKRLAPPSKTDSKSSQDDPFEFN